MRSKTAWSPPGWPWELELLALVFVITAIAIPAYLQYVQPEASQENMSLISRAVQVERQDMGTWQDFTSFFWAFAIVGLYVTHIVVAFASSDWISTPFTHLISPVGFSMITYYRLHRLAVESDNAVHVVSGTLGEIAIWVVGVLLITGLLARLRMSRHLVAFRDIEWEVTSPTLVDKTYVELLAFFRPLIYPPRRYRACPQGILIEGWLYIMPIPFDAISSVDSVRKANLMSSGYYVATSAQSLVRVNLSEHAEPLFLSPAERDEFLGYCDHYLAPKRTGTHAGRTRSSTRSGHVRRTVTQKPVSKTGTVSDDTVA